MTRLEDFSQLKPLKPAPPPPRKPEPAPEARALAGAASGADYFSSLLGPARAVKPRAAPSAAAPAAPSRITVVTPGNVQRAREQQARAAFDMERDALNKEIAELKLDYSEVSEEKSALAAELEARDAALAAAEAESARLGAELAAALGQLEEANGRLAAAAAELAAERAAPKSDPAAQARAAAAIAALEAENARLAAELAEARRTALSSSVLIDKPEGLSERFVGEIREHALEALAEACRAADAAGRLRRARILEAVLFSNPRSGALESRRAELKRILRGQNSRLNAEAIAALEKLGFRCLDGAKHHKLDWAGVRAVLSKTPSDHRAAENSAAEIANRVF